VLIVAVILFSYRKE